MSARPCLDQAASPLQCSTSAHESEAGAAAGPATGRNRQRSEEHTSELQSLMRISYAVFCLKKKKKQTYDRNQTTTTSTTKTKNYSHDIIYDIIKQKVKLV